MDPPEDFGYQVFNDTIFSDFRLFVNLHSAVQHELVPGGNEKAR
jgi:hypothetical protein